MQVKITSVTSGRFTKGLRGYGESTDSPDLLASGRGPKIKKPRVAWLIHVAPVATLAAARVCVIGVQDNANHRGHGGARGRATKEFINAAFCGNMARTR
jgi:hypothetical protein